MSMANQEVLTSAIQSLEAHLQAFFPHADSVTDEDNAAATTLATHAASKSNEATRQASVSTAHHTPKTETPPATVVPLAAVTADSPQPESSEEFEYEEVEVEVEEDDEVVDEETVAAALAADQSNSRFVRRSS